MTRFGMLLMLAAMVGVAGLGSSTSTAPAPAEDRSAIAEDKSATPQAADDEADGQEARDLATNPAAKFEYVDVFVDAGAQSLAAWQVDVRAEKGEVKIVGIEGGEHPAFANPPYYDPVAMQHDRVIIAAFNTGKDLPTGKTRVARVHVMIVGDEAPDFTAIVQTAANAEGKEFPAAVQLSQGDSR